MTTSVLHVRSSSGLYGAEKALLSLASAMPPPFRAYVAALHPPDDRSPLERECKQRGVPFFSLKSKGRFDVASAKRLAQLARTDGISLLHAHDYKSLAICLLAGARARIPVVATYHGDTGASGALIAYEALARACGNFCAAVAAVSRPLQQKVRGWVKAAPVEHIPNAVAAAAPLLPEEQARAREAFGIPQDVLALSVLGRLSVEKGHAVLIEALKRMAKPPHVLIAGDGPLREPLQASCGDLPVRFLGFQSDVRRVYAACDAVALPSLTEGLPLVALEAMAHRRAVVATAVGEVPHVLREGAGLVVPPGDASALARGLEEMFSSAKLREACAQQGLVRVESEYGLPAMAEAYVQKIYLPALACASEKAPVASHLR